MAAAEYARKLLDVLRQPEDSERNCSHECPPASLKSASDPAGRLPNMGSSSDLVGRLDFNPGKDFQDEVYHRFGSTVHFNSSSPFGSFFLLATLRRFLFRLTEESVALTLQSCLGGSADKFHVKFLSTNHFRFSVASKRVGFLIYKLRRVISSSFDVYFHLWNNGTAHWEREKRAWEIEQEKEWTTVLSKSAKRQAKAKAKDQNPVQKKSASLNLLFNTLDMSFSLEPFVLLSWRPKSLLLTFLVLARILVALFSRVLRPACKDPPIQEAIVVIADLIPRLMQFQIPMAVWQTL